MAPPSLNPPETWLPARQFAVRLLRRLDRFLHIEAASGILLLVAALCALVWANSPWASAYEALFHTEIVFGIGGSESRESLHFWINEGLMAIFFLVVGLEIRREIQEGELSEPRRAALPLAAAVGGMLVPALIYGLMNREPPVQQGWGVPMATDIAFAVGVLTLLGKRVPPALRVLLLALAIIDDIGAILVIALFYSSGVSATGFVIAGLGVFGVLLLQRLGVRRALAYVVPGSVVWWGLLRAGVHPTLAGVVLGLLTPVTPWFGREGFLVAAEQALADVRRDPSEQAVRDPLHRLQQAQREALSPVVRVEAALHPWVAYAIMPLFALANAGVSLKGFTLEESGANSVFWGVLLGLLCGKPLGIAGASYLSVKSGLCALPRGVSFLGIWLVGAVAGIGFTMAIFIAGLAFEQASLLAVAKLAVLSASALAALVGFALGRLVLSPHPHAGAAITGAEAEASTER